MAIVVKHGHKKSHFDCPPLTEEVLDYEEWQTALCKSADTKAAIELLNCFPNFTHPYLLLPLVT